MGGWSLASAAEAGEDAGVAVDAPLGGGSVGDVGEQVGEGFGGDVPEAEELDARGVDDVCVEVGQVVDACGGGGVFAFEVDGGDFAHADVEVGLDESDEGGLADAGVSGEDGGVCDEEVSEDGFGAGSGGAGFVGEEAEGAVVGQDVAGVGEEVGLGFAEVDFVEADDGFEPASSGGDEHAVDEPPLRGGLIDGDDDQHAGGVGDDGVAFEGFEGVGAGEERFAGEDGFDDAFFGSGLVAAWLASDPDEVADDGGFAAEAGECFADGAEDGVSFEVDLGVEGEHLADPTEGELVDVGGFGAEFGGFFEFSSAQRFVAAVEAFDGVDVVGVVVAGEESAGEILVARFAPGRTGGHPWEV